MRYRAITAPGTAPVKSSLMKRCSTASDHAGSLAVRRVSVNRSDMRLLPICYFGFTDGSPPGVPGGGIIGILSPDGGGVCFICGSTSAGGLMTPPERLSSELVDPLTGGSARALGCFAPCSSAAAARLIEPQTAMMRSDILHIEASECCRHAKQTHAVRGLSPKDLGRTAGTFRHCLELGPANRRVADARAEPAIGPCEHVLAPDQPRIAHQALGDQIGVLDEIGAVADDAGDERCVSGKLYVLEDAPFVLVAGVRGLDRIASGTHTEDQVDNVAERNVVVVRSVEAAPAHMQSDLFFTDVAQRIVQRIDAQRCVLAVIGETDVGQAVPAVGEVGIVNLQLKSGIDDRLVLL